MGTEDRARPRGAWSADRQPRAHRQQEAALTTDGTVPVVSLHLEVFQMQNSRLHLFYPLPLKEASSFFLRGPKPTRQWREASCLVQGTGRSCCEKASGQIRRRRQATALSRLPSPWKRDLWVVCFFLSLCFRDEAREAQRRGMAGTRVSSLPARPSLPSGSRSARSAFVSASSFSL